VGRIGHAGRQVFPDRFAEDGEMTLLIDPTSRLLAEMIQGTALRHRVLAGNLANVETPGYQAQDVSFSVALEEAGRVAAGGGNAPSRVQPTITTDAEAPIRRDGSTVDLDRQMVRLSQNTQWHNAMLQILASRFTQMKTAIKGQA
jgi:flagellar basal-body rod protein FlgB